MTVDQTLRAIRRCGATASYHHGTFRINWPDLPRASAILATSKDDAMVQAEVLAKRYRSEVASVAD